ncbi:MAG: DUF4411 family protein [Deltaproteobacteria bacterium]
MYIFDTSPLIDLFRHYYPDLFPTLWDNFNGLVDNGSIISTRENLREINVRTDDLQEWANDNGNIFEEISIDEGKFIRQIYGVPLFQHNIQQQKLLKGGLNADPFVIAKAAVRGAHVVTGEVFKPNSAKIPNICQHFSVPCLNLKQFMEQEGWRF